MIKDLEHLTYEERLNEVGFVTLEKARLRSGLSSVYKCLMRRCKEDGARLFSVVLSDGTKANGHKPKHWRLHLNTRKHFFTVRVTEHWHRLLREVLESPSLETVKT